MKNPTAFVIQPFTKASEAVYELIVSAAAEAGVSAFRADTITETSPIMDSIQKAIKEASFVVADVSEANPNVMYEIGFAQAHNRPMILLANSSLSVPFDLAGVRIFIYNLSNPVEIVSLLAMTMKAIVKDPDSFSFASLRAEREKKQSVFVSYSHFDREYLDRLLVHLKPLEKDGVIDLWVDTRLRAGDRWKKEIEKALSRSTVALLLVSADFLASDFITDNELPPLLRNAEEKGTRIIPLILKPCRFTRDKNLRHFQAINAPDRSLIRISEGEQESLYDAVALEIERTTQRG
jgi:hypothetical protein